MFDYVNASFQTKYYVVSSKESFGTGLISSVYIMNIILVLVIFTRAFLPIRQKYYVCSTGSKWNTDWCTL
jgi:hypothetical protein